MDGGFDLSLLAVYFIKGGKTLDTSHGSIYHCWISVYDWDGTSIYLPQL